jgi:hypothetical protein
MFLLIKKVLSIVRAKRCCLEIGQEWYSRKLELDVDFRLEGIFLKNCTKNC